MIIRRKKEKPVLQNITVFLDLVKQKRKQFESYKYRNKKAQKIYAQHMINPLLSQIFERQRDCAKILKIDRGTLRKYLNNQEKRHFKKVWKLQTV